MQSIYRSLVLCGCALAVSACGTSSYGTASGTIATSGGTGTGTGTGGTGGLAGGGDSGIGGTHNTVMSSAPPVSVQVGTTATIAVTFVASDGRAISGFAINGSLGAALPAGWTGPDSFACMTVSTGSGCVLKLTFAPAAYALNKTVTLNYVFVDNSGEPVTDGTMMFTYNATTSDNVVAMATPVGQINAMVNAGTTPLSMSFATDDGFPATNFAIDASSLPPGWSVTSPTSCATISGAAPCVVTWTYAPTAPASGTYTVGYSFNDDSGTLKTGTYPVMYAAIDHNTVIYSQAPATIAGTTGTPMTVTLTFNTSDGYPATALNIDTSALPATDWSAAPLPPACASVSTGTACQLTLTYTPTAPTASTTDALAYTYVDNAGTAQSGTLFVTYSST